MAPRPRTLAIPPTTAHSRGRIFGLAAGGLAITAPRRAEILQALAAGQYVEPLTVDARTFLQGPDPNRNYSRFTPGAMVRMAKTFVGAPFMRDHMQHDSTARIGTILASKLVTVSGGDAPDNEPDDDPDDALAFAALAFAGGDARRLAMAAPSPVVKGMRQTLEVVKPWAQAGILDGTITSFSIAWTPNTPDQPLCSICGSSMFSLECSHFPSDSVEMKSGDKRICEMVWNDVAGLETSAVSVPAVLGTEIEGVRAALAADRSKIAGAARTRAGEQGQLAADKPPAIHSENEMKSIAKKLGLDDDADERTILAALTTSAAEKKATELALTATEERLGRLEAELAERRTGDQARRTEAMLAAVRAKKGPKLGADGQPVRGGTGWEESALELAAASLDRAEAWVKSLRQEVPLGAGAGATPDPMPAKPALSLTWQERKMAKAVGTTEEAALATKRQMATEEAVRQAEEAADEYRQEMIDRARKGIEGR